MTQELVICRGKNPKQTQMTEIIPPSPDAMVCLLDLHSWNSTHDTYPVVKDKLGDLLLVFSPELLQVLERFPLISARVRERLSQSLCGLHPLPSLRITFRDWDSVVV